LPYHPLGLDFQPNFERVVECHDGVLEKPLPETGGVYFAGLYPVTGVVLATCADAWLGPIGLPPEPGDFCANAKEENASPRPRAAAAMRNPNIVEHLIERRDHGAASQAAGSTGESRSSPLNGLIALGGPLGRDSFLTAGRLNLLSGRTSLTLFRHVGRAESTLGDHPVRRFRLLEAHFASRLDSCLIGFGGQSANQFLAAELAIDAHYALS
jgi:hypothetical protein